MYDLNVVFVLLVMLAAAFFYSMFVGLSGHRTFEEKLVNTFDVLKKNKMSLYKMEGTQENELRYFYLVEVWEYTETDPENDILLVQEMSEERKQRTYIARKKLKKLDIDSESEKIKDLIARKNAQFEKRVFGEEEIKNRERIVENRKKLGLEY